MLDDAFENPFYAGSERIITDRYSFGITYSKRLLNGGELHADATLTRHKRNATNDTFLGDYEEIFGEAPPIDELRPYLADEKLYVSSVNYTYPLGGSHRLLAGMQYSRNELDESGKYVDADISESYTSYSNKKADQFGAYLQDEFFLSENFEIVAGIRFDYHKSEDNFRGSGNVAADGLDPIEYDESTFNPRFAVKFNAAENLIFRGSFGTGFRVPYGFSEDLHLCSGSPRVYKAADLKPEKSRSLSFTVDYSLSPANLSLNLYRTDLTDAISFAEADDDVINQGYTYQWENIDDAFVMGMEIGGQLLVTDNLSATLNFAVNKSEYDHGRTDWEGTEYYEISKKISRYPETSGGVKIDFSPGKWSFIIDGDYKGTMYIDYIEAENEEDKKIKRTESFITMNAKMSYTILNGYTVYAGAKNLTDYVQEEKHTDDAAFIYAPVYGRIIYGGLKISL
jgi:outer membrane receptor for ferrienterochelin and colicins